MGNSNVDLPAATLALLIGDEPARKAIHAGWEILRPFIADRPDLLHPGVGDYVSATVLLGAAPGLIGDIAEQAEARGYARAVERLRDDERYRDWWTAQPTPAAERYWKSEARNHLADYLETVERPLPTRESPDA